MVGRFWRVVLLTLVLIVFAGAARADKSYTVDGLRIKAQTHADGDLSVTESRLYSFDGRFKYAYRTFSRRGGIDYADFTVREDGVDYLENDSEDPGTFRISEDGDEIELRWFYRARNESRRFEIGYRVPKLIRRHPDAAVLYYQFLGSDFNQASANVELIVTPHERLAAGVVRQWLHGPLWAESTTDAGGVISAWCERLPRRQFLELRALYPPEAFADAPAVEGAIVPGVLAEEAEMAEAANRRREEVRLGAIQRADRMRKGAIAMPVLCLLGLVGWIAIYLRFGRTPAIPSRAGISRDIPSDLPPAQVKFLIAGRVIDGNSLMATLLDLSGRGFLEFHEETEEKTHALGIKKTRNKHYWCLRSSYHREHLSDLSTYESMLLDFVFKDLAGGDRADMDIFKSNQKKTRKFFLRWKEAVKSEADARGFYAPEGFTGRKFGIYLGALMVLLSAGFGFYVYEWAFLPGVVGVLMIPISLGMVHHSRKGAIEAARWKALRGYLKKDRSHHAGFLDSVQGYLIYGVALGIGKKALVDLGDRIPQGRHVGFLPWYHVHGGSGHLSGSSFGVAFSASVASVNSSMSSAAGAGGGASAGGGGAGGGGGGAG